MYFFVSKCLKMIDIGCFNMSGLDKSKDKLSVDWIDT